MKQSKYNYIIKNPSNNNYLIYNTLFNSFAEINSDELVQLKNISSCQDYHTELIESFKSYGLICDNDFDELEKAKMVVSMRIKGLTKAVKKILTIAIVPTFKCNFKCLYCFETDELKSREDLMDINVQEALLKYIEKQFKSGVEFFNLNYFGGEPLLGMKIIEEIQPKILILCEKHNIKLKTDIITNGFLLNPENIKTLRNLKCENYQITIDGTKDIHNTMRYYPEDPNSNYDTLMMNIKNCRDFFRINLRINVNQNNYQDAFDLVNDFVYRKLWPHKNIKFYLGRLHDGPTNKVSKFSRNDFGKADCEFRQFLTLRYNELNNSTDAKYRFLFPTYSKSAGCGMNYSDRFFTIGPDGRVYFCWDYMNFKEDAVASIFDLAEDNYSKKFLHDFKITLKKREEKGCFKCKLLPVCEPECFYYYIRFKENDRSCSVWKGVPKMLLTQYNFSVKHPEMVDKNLDEYEFKV
jgi:uncharacterized protein